VDSWWTERTRRSCFAVQYLSSANERQIFAAQGYVVLAINYRGSNGRGAEFTRSIWSDWGNKEVADLQAGVNWQFRKGSQIPTG